MLTSRVSRRSSSALNARRAKLKLDRICCSIVAGQKGIGRRTDDPRLAKCAEHPILAEPVARAVGLPRRLLVGEKRRILRAQTDAGEQVHRAILAEQIAPADFEKRAGRDLQLLGRDAAGGLRPDPRAGLQPASVSDRRRGRLLDRDHDVTGGLDAVSELGDAGAPEQPERGQAALAFGHGRQSERIARP